jgi:hypothetical protein
MDHPTYNNALRILRQNDALERVAIIDICGLVDSLRGESYWNKWALRQFSPTIDALQLPKDLQKGNVSALPQEYFLSVNQSIALIKVPATPKEYLDYVGPKTRNMIRKAQKNNYTSGAFIWNEHLESIHSINTSKAVRQNSPMSASYKNFPGTSGEHISIRRCGIFLRSTLVAYANCTVLNNLLVINTILGHGDHLRFGVMNLLIYSIVQLATKTPNLQYINYLTLRPGGLGRFKKNAGFRPYSCFFRRETAQ